MNATLREILEQVLRGLAESVMLLEILILLGVALAIIVGTRPDFRKAIISKVKSLVK